MVQHLNELRAMHSNGLASLVVSVTRLLGYQPRLLLLLGCVRVRAVSLLIPLRFNEGAAFEPWSDLVVDVVGRHDEVVGVDRVLVARLRSVIDLVSVIVLLLSLSLW